MINTDAEIIHGLKAGYKERIAWEKRLYSVYAYFIDEGCRKYNLSYDDSFSSYSDALLAVLHNILLNRFDGRSSLKTYLFQIFCNKCVDQVRKNTTNKQQVHYNTTATELLDQLPDHSRTMVEQLIDRQKKTVIKQHIESLGDKCKEILLLFEDCLSDKQIADELEYNNAAVAKTTRLRCLEKLREKVGNIILNL